MMKIREEYKKVKKSLARKLLEAFCLLNLIQKGHCFMEFYFDRAFG